MSINIEINGIISPILNISKIAFINVKKIIKLKFFNHWLGRRFIKLEIYSFKDLPQNNINYPLEILIIFKFILINRYIKFRRFPLKTYLNWLFYLF